MSLSFPGTSAGRAPAAALGVTALPFTVAGWVRPGSFASTGYCFYLGTGAASNAHAHVVTVASDATVRASARGATGTTGAGTAVSGNSTTLNQWSYVVAVFASSSNRRIILDGNTASAHTNTTAVTVNTPTLEVLGNEVNNGGYGAGINAQMENWALWNVALTDAEAVQLAAGVQPPDIRLTGLKHWWRHMTLAQDVMGGGNLTLEGTSESTAAPIQRGRVMRPKNVDRPTPATPAGGMRVAVFI